MKKFIILLILLLTPVVCANEEQTLTSVTYLVYRQNFFPQDRFKIKITPEEYRLFSDTGKNKLSDVKGQPFALTNYTLNYDGKYALWSVNANEIEVAYILTMTTLHYIYKISETQVIEEYDNKDRRIKKYAITTISAEVPEDFYEIVITTGT